MNENKEKTKDNHNQTAAPSEVRLQKYLADKGIASRRSAEKMIAEGRISVNGQMVTEMGSKVRPEKDQIRVDGKLIEREVVLRYILLNKPPGYICSAQDDRGRRTVMDLIDGVSERIYPVGRLDYDTAGLLLLTNDGQLTNLLLHPSHQVDKTYLAEISGGIDNAAVEKLRRGVRLQDGRTAPAKVNVVKRGGDITRVEITIHEGKNRQVRRMMEAVGHPVLRLKRIKIAFLDAKDLRLGEWRELSGSEVRRLKQL